ncbi:MAG: helix-turn-helix transcriptional regulator [Bacteroidota bacterium]
MKNRRIDLGHTLIRYRYARGFTQQYVANAFEISLTAYKKWEKKKDSFNLLQLKKIGELYNIPVELVIIDSYIDKKTRLVFNEKTF